MSKSMERYSNNGVQVYDDYQCREICKTSSLIEAKEVCQELNSLFDDTQDTIEKLQEITTRLNETEEYTDNIIKLIDIRIEENKQLALIHFRTPEDDYINEYESRANELSQLKKLIQDGKLF